MKWFKDINDEQFWIIIWSLVFTTILLLSIIVSINIDRDDSKRLELVKQGKTPEEVVCIMDSTSNACITYIASKNDNMNIINLKN